MAGWDDIAALLARGEGVRSLLDANARALLGEQDGAGLVGEGACGTDARVPCGGEMLRLQTGCPPPRSLVRGMPFLLLLPPATMSDCGVRPHFISSAEMLEGCEGLPDADAGAAAGERGRARLLWEALSACALGGAPQAALRALLEGHDAVADLLSAEDVHTLRAVDPAVLVSLVCALEASDAEGERIAQFAELLLRDVLTHLAARSAAAEERSLPPELWPLLRCLLFASGAMRLGAAEFALFLELSLRLPHELLAVRDALATSAAEMYAEHVISCL